MLLFNLVFLLGAVSMAVGAALHPIRQRQLVSTSSDVCSQVTVTETITQPPATVTVALENPSQIAASISNDISIESVYWSDQSELAPISAPTVTTTHELTVTEVVPVVKATLTSSPNNNTGPYFVSVGPSTTDWSLTDYTPVSSMTIGITTVTLSPVPPLTSASPTTTVQSTLYLTLTTRKTDTSTVRGPFPLSTGGIFTGPKSYGWNSTSTTLVAGASGSVSRLPVPLVSHTTVSNITTVIVTANMTAYPTMRATTTISSSFSEETEYGYGYGFGFGSGDASHGTGLIKRQTCTLVYATLNGNVVSWCNNWDGSTVVEQTTFITTYTPMPITPTPTSSSPSTPSASVPISCTPADNLIPLTPAASTTISANPATTSCGLTGAFEIDFDELPAYSPPDNNTADFPPIFNPYDHFYWADGWSYGPPPNEPYPPQNGSHLGEYVPSQSTNASTSGSPDAGDVPSGGFGAGPRHYDSAYWFNAASAYIGCDNGATDPSVICDFVATGYKYNAATGLDEVVVTEHFPQPPCPDFQNCLLRQIFFNEQFEGLSGLSFYAVVLGQQKIFFIDSIEMAWWNNTCSAGLERGRSR